MASRNRYPRQPLNDGPRGFRDGPPPPFPRERGPIPFHHLEEELAFRDDEIRRVHADNQLLVEENMGLRRELGAIREELHMLSQAIPKIQADKDLEARDLIQRGLKLEAELRGLEPIKAEYSQLQNEVQKLDASREELASKVQGLKQDLKHFQGENKQILALKSEIDGLRQEVARARSAYEYEKKAKAEQLEQKQSMDKNLFSMSKELEKLRADLDKRAMSSGSGNYGAMKPGTDRGYPSMYGDNYGGDRGFYGAGSWGPNEPRGFPRH